MPGIRISKQLKAQLPKDERTDLEDFLWKKSGGKCFLCERKLNRAKDVIEADHDEPDAEGGDTTRENLNLVHLSCNRVKRNNPSIDVAPYLKLLAYEDEHGSGLKYDGYLAHFGITPKPTTIEINAGQASFEFPDGTDATVPVFVEKNEKGEFKYAFVEVPRNAIYNDEECQPRAVKPNHVWAIYSDIQSNPLHEPPSARVDGAPRGKWKLVMFDGQHKTVACWMSGRDRVLIKVYLNITVQEAVRLVNSIQAKIKKLPLSPFELAAKLSDEWRHKLEEYADRVGADGSEKGFIDSLPPGERGRAKSAFRSALISGILDQDDFLFFKYVKHGFQEATLALTEAQLTNKLIMPLLHVAPLEEPAADASDMRVREQENLTKALNMLAQQVFEIPKMTDQQKERARRMLYQSSLSYAAEMIRDVFTHILTVDKSRALIEKAPSRTQWKKIEEAIKRLANHPIWTVDLEETAKTRAVGLALSKNQDAKKAFSDVWLRVGYVVGADKLPNDWAT